MHACKYIQYDKSKCYVIAGALMLGLIYALGVQQQYDGVCERLHVHLTLGHVAQES
jgi:hypothetical protein